jgi:hypothetical protein
LRTRNEVSIREAVLLAGNAVDDILDFRAGFTSNAMVDPQGEARVDKVFGGCSGRVEVDSSVTNCHTGI